MLSPFSGSTFEPGFLAWENLEPYFLSEPVDFPNPLTHEPDLSGSGTSSPDTTNKSTDPDRVDSKNKTPGSRNPSCLKLKPTVDEMKRRRKISNRESARRSRLRKQEHEENLRTQVDRLKVENRELMNRVRCVAHYNRLFWTENEYLRSEAAVLARTLWNIRQVLLARQLLNPVRINNYLPINNLIT